jgi:hypothetical protein
VAVIGLNTPFEHRRTRARFPDRPRQAQRQ